VRRFSVPARVRDRALMGVVAFLLLMTAEFALSVSVFGRSGAEFMASLTTAAGMIGLAGQVFFATFPIAQLRRPSPRRHASE
jgi:hypothetical protein